eukprot:gene19590-30047_t
MISQAVAKRGHPCAALLIVMAAVSVLVDAKSCGFDERYRAKKERKYSAVQFNRTATQTFNESAGVLPSMHLNVSRKIPERSRSRRLTCPFSSSGESGSSSGGDLCYGCLSTDEADERAKADSRVDPWKYFGGEGDKSIPTSHSKLSCASNFINWRPLSPCTNPEVTNAYLDAAKTTQNVRRLRHHRSTSTHALKIRFNIFDYASSDFPKETRFCHEAIYLKDVHIDSDGDCNCGTSLEFLSGYGGSGRLSSGTGSCSGDGCKTTIGDIVYYEDSCTDCRCGNGYADYFSQEEIEFYVDKMNGEDYFGFGDQIKFEGTRQLAVPSAQLWEKLTEGDIDSNSDDHVDSTVDDDLIAEINALFGVSSGMQSSSRQKDSDPPDIISEYIEVFVLPNIGGGGSANKRGDPGQPAVAFYMANSLKRHDRTTILHTIVHEIGHTMGLLHTFQGEGGLVGEDGTCSVCTPSDDTGEKTGDLIADTATTTSNISSADLDTCTKTIGNENTHCRTISTEGKNMDNWMSYDPDVCSTTFTPMQQARMRCFIDQDFSDYHLPDLAPAIVPLRITTIDA